MVHAITFTVSELEKKLRRKEVEQTFRPESYMVKERLMEAFRDGSPVHVFFRSEHVGDVKIAAVELIKPSDLGELDVRREGFASLEEMVNTMKRKGIYPSEDKKIYRLHLRWL